AGESRAGSLRRLDLGFNKIGPRGAKALARSPLGETLTRLDLSGNPIGNSGLKALAASPRLGGLRRLGLYQCDVTRQGAKALLSPPPVDGCALLRLEGNASGRRAGGARGPRRGARLEQGERLTADEVVRRVKAQPPRCLRGVLARTDTELLRRFPRDRLDHE